MDERLALKCSYEKAGAFAAGILFSVLCLFAAWPGEGVFTVASRLSAAAWAAVNLSLPAL